MARASLRYQGHRDPQEALRKRLRELAASRVRFGYRRLTVLLRRDGWRVNAKQIYRLYTEESLMVRTKVRVRAARRNRVPQVMTTELLRTSRRCLLLIIPRRWKVHISIPRGWTAVCSQMLMLTKLMQKTRGEAASAHGLSQQVHPSLGASAGTPLQSWYVARQRRRNVKQPRLSAHNVGAVFVNTPDI